MRAGQILAEMLGMVCHPEYFKQGYEQTVYSCLYMFPTHIVLGHCRAF